MVESTERRDALGTSASGAGMVKTSADASRPAGASTGWASVLEALGRHTVASPMISPLARGEAQPTRRKGVKRGAWRRIGSSGKLETVGARDGACSITA